MLSLLNLGNLEIGPILFRQCFNMAAPLNFHKWQINVQLKVIFKHELKTSDSLERLIHWPWICQTDKIVPNVQFSGHKFKHPRCYLLFLVVKLGYVTLVSRYMNQPNRAQIVYWISCLQQFNLVLCLWFYLNLDYHEILVIWKFTS